MKQLERILEWGGTRRDIAFLIISGLALLASLLPHPPLPFDPAWVAVVLCGLPIILEAVIGLVTLTLQPMYWCPSPSSPPSSSARISQLVRWPLSCSWAVSWRS